MFLINEIEFIPFQQNKYIILNLINAACDTIGKYDKNWELEKEKEDIWKNRSSIYFDKCSKCKYRYLCGTGCPAAEPDKEGSFDPKTYRCVDFKKILNALILTNLNLE